MARRKFVLPVDQLLMVVEYPSYARLKFYGPGSLLIDAGPLNPHADIVQSRLGAMNGTLDPFQLRRNTDQFALNRFDTQEPLNFTQIGSDDLYGAHEDFVLGPDFGDADSVFSELEAAVNTSKDSACADRLHIVSNASQNKIGVRMASSDTEGRAGSLWGRRWAAIVERGGPRRLPPPPRRGASIPPHNSSAEPQG